MAREILSSASEDIDQLTFRDFAESFSLLERIPPHDQIDAGSEDAYQLMLNAADVESAEQWFASLRPFVEIDHDIDIALGPGCVAGNRAE